MARDIFEKMAQFLTSKSKHNCQIKYNKLRQRYGSFEKVVENLTKDNEKYSINLRKIA
jgi:hypothetical protein